jgi:hypothetical protein
MTTQATHTRRHTMTTHTDPENYKIKVYNAGAARLELPFVGRAIGQPISAANMAKAFNKIEKCLQQLGISQCPVCEQPQGPSGYCGLGGICPIAGQSMTGWTRSATCPP